LSDKESQRWITTALAPTAACQGRHGDRDRRSRERHLCPLCNAAEQHFHVIARSMHDRKLANGTGLYAASETMAVVDRRTIVLPARAQRANVSAVLELRFGAVNLLAANQIPAPSA